MVARKHIIVFLCTHCNASCRAVYLAPPSEPRMDIGRVFHYLTVIDILSVIVSGQKHNQYLCRCRCGKETRTCFSHLRRGIVKSCGCLNSERTRLRNLTHGEATPGNRSREHVCWGSMWQRCTNPKTQSYRHYGGRGIVVCDRWKKFENFLQDMGRKPSPDYSIDRINNDGNYEPSNCRWATKSQQMRNRRRKNPLLQPKLDQ